MKAAADSVVGDMLTEDVIPTPVGPYGESKIAAESYIKEHFILPTTSSGYLPLLNSPVNRGKQPLRRRRM